jgi:hypothetical protein
MLTRSKTLTRIDKIKYDEKNINVDNDYKSMIFEKEDKSNKVSIMTRTKIMSRSKSGNDLVQNE